MKRSKTLKIANTALFAALICAATVTVQIPVPATHGYVNLGDCFVILAGVFLGPLCGALAGGFGSALSDIIFGYTAYAPATLMIKALMALTAGIITRKFKSRHGIILGALPAEIIMTGGYLLYESVILRYGRAAFAEIPMNLIQGAAGMIVSYLLYSAIYKSEKLKRILSGKGE